MNAWRLPALATVLITGAATGGCATIIHGSVQQIPVSSVPAGATVSVDGADVGRTPCVVVVARGRNHTIRVALDGYDAAGVTVTRELSPWLWANIANGVLPGLTIDAIQGGLYELAPASVALTLPAMAPTR